MPDKTPNYKSVGVPIATYDDIQQIAEQLSAEKGIQVKVGPALVYIVNFYKENHSKGKR